VSIVCFLHKTIDYQCIRMIGVFIIQVLLLPLTIFWFLMRLVNALFLSNVIASEWGAIETFLTSDLRELKCLSGFSGFVVCLALFFTKGLRCYSTISQK